MKSKEYPLYTSAEPAGHSGMSSSWLCLVNRKLSWCGASMQGPGGPGAPLAPVGPCNPAVPVERVTCCHGEASHSRLYIVLQNRAETS